MVDAVTCIATALFMTMPVHLDRVIDGDTIVAWVESDVDVAVFKDIRLAAKRHETIRLLGVDTPERKKGARATAFTEEWINTRHSVFVKTNMKRDGFGRLLARVCAPDGCLDEALIGAGLGEVYCP